MTKRGRERLYEGKAKIIYATDDPNEYMVHFKDDATALNGKKKALIERKGELNLAITVLLFRYLERQGVATHLLDVLGERDLLVRKLSMIPIEVVVRNRVAGSLAKRFNLEEGTPLVEPVLEFYLKNDELDDPMLNEDHIRMLDLADAETVAALKRLALHINEMLCERLAAAKLVLVDFKLEFGRDEHGQLVLGDEISPDCCRIWDADTGERLDKDRFRRDLGNVREAYEEVLRRLQESR